MHLKYAEMLATVVQEALSLLPYSKSIILGLKLKVHINRRLYYVQENPKFSERLQIK